MGVVHSTLQSFTRPTRSSVSDVNEDDIEPQFSIGGGAKVGSNNSNSEQKSHCHTTTTNNHHHHNKVVIPSHTTSSNYDEEETAVNGASSPINISNLACKLCGDNNINNTDYGPSTNAKKCTSAKGEDEITATKGIDATSKHTTTNCINTSQKSPNLNYAEGGNKPPSAEDKTEMTRQSRVQNNEYNYPTTTDINSYNNSSQNNAGIIGAPSASGAQNNITIGALRDGGGDMVQAYTILTNAHILEHVMEYLVPQDVVKLSQVSKRFHQSNVWREMLESHHINCMVEVRKDETYNNGLWIDEFRCELIDLKARKHCGMPKWQDNKEQDAWALLRVLNELLHDEETQDFRIRTAWEYFYTTEYGYFVDEERHEYLTEFDSRVNNVLGGMAVDCLKRCQELVRIVILSVPYKARETVVLSCIHEDSKQLFDCCHGFNTTEGPTFDSSKTNNCLDLARIDLLLKKMIDALSVDTLEVDEDDTVEFESAGDGFDNDGVGLEDNNEAEQSDAEQADTEQSMHVEPIDGVGLEDNDEADRSDAEQADTEQSMHVEPIPTSDATKAEPSDTTVPLRQSGRKRNKEVPSRSSSTTTAAAKSNILSKKRKAPTESSATEETSDDVEDIVERESKKQKCTNNGTVGFHEVALDDVEMEDAENDASATAGSGTNIQTGVPPSSSSEGRPELDQLYEKLSTLSDDIKSATGGIDHVIIMHDTIRSVLDDVATRLSSDSFNSNKHVMQAREAQSLVEDLLIIPHISSLTDAIVDYENFDRDKDSEVIYCEVSTCTNRCLEMEVCSSCSKQVCTYYCYDENTDMCLECKQSKKKKGGNKKKGGSRRHPQNGKKEQVTERDIDEMLRLRIEAGGNRWSIIESRIESSYMDRLTMNHIWNSGMSHLPRFLGENMQTVPLKDCVDENGNLLDRYGTNWEEYRNCSNEDIKVTDTPPVSKSKHLLDVRSSSLMLFLRVLYSKPGKNGNFVLDDHLAVNPASPQCAKDKAMLMTRNAMVNANFLALSIHCPSLFTMFVPFQYRQVVGTNELMRIPIDVKQASLQAFLRGILHYPTNVTAPILDQSGTLRRFHGDEAISLALSVLDANYTEKKNEIDEAIQEVDQRIKDEQDKHEQFVNDLELPISLQILELMDKYRGLSRSESTPMAFETFQDEFLVLCKELSAKLPQFEAIEKWEDFSFFTVDDFMDGNKRTLFGPFIMDYFRLVGDPSILRIVNESWASYNLNHSIRDGKGDNPSSVAKHQGANALLGEVRKFEMTVQSAEVHRRDEDATEGRGQDQSDKKDVIIGGGKLKDIKQWLEMTESERLKFLVPIRFMFLLSSLLYMGAFSEAEEVPFDMNSIRTEFVLMFGLDADDFTRCNAKWINSSRGNIKKNSFGTCAGRDGIFLQMLVYLISALCKRDPDDELREEDARLDKVPPSEQFAFHLDHEGKKYCHPARMHKDYGLVFLLNEYASALMPMSSITHDVRTKNQNIAAKKNGIEDNKKSTISRDFTKKSVEGYSMARTEKLCCYTDEAMKKWLEEKK